MTWEEGPGIVVLPDGPEYLGAGCEASWQRRAVFRVGEITTTTLKLRPVKAKAGRLVAAALLGGKRTVPKIVITMTDGVMNRQTFKPKISIQGPKH